MRLPPFLKKYFWDADVTKTDLNTHAPYIIERILEYGDEKAFSWLQKNVRRERIKKVLMESRALSPQSATFWALILGVPKHKIPCLQKQFRDIRSRHWIW